VTGYRPRHELAHEPEPGTAPPVGSMCLEYERAIGAVPLGAPVPDADPWGIPPAGEWTDRLLAELREAPTVLDALEEPAHVDQLKQLAADVAAYMSAQNMRMTAAVGRAAGCAHATPSGARKARASMKETSPRLLDLFCGAGEHLGRREHL